MKVILTEDIDALGAMGAMVDVAKGYARNFLIPQGKAVAATPGNLARVEQTKVQYAQRREQEQEAARVQVAQLEGVSFTIVQRVGEEDRLYGSVTAGMIAEAMAAKGYQVNKKELELPEAIKKLGTYEVAVRLAPGVKARISVEVVAAED